VRPTDAAGGPAPAEPGAGAPGAGLPAAVAGADAGAAPVAGPAVRPPTLWQAARTPRMLGLLVLFLAIAAVCARLGAWQLERAEIRGAAAQAARLAEVEAAVPVPIEDVLAPQQSFDGALVGRRVEVTGVYEADGQLLVTDRVLDGETGSLVLTPLRVTSTDPEVDGAVLPVVRGWVPDGTATDDAALAVPDGEVQVVAYLQASEDSGAAPTGDGTADSISSAELLGLWGGPIWTGYGVLTDSDPAQPAAVELLPPPTRSGTGLNIQNLGYAAQWWIFGGFAVFLWVRLLKDEVLRGVPAAPADDPADEPAPAPAP
jgi:cytochrome oxidase assembly protein ShyY1